MERKSLRHDIEEYEQLGLGLVIEEEERSEKGYVSPAEARKRSLAAYHALEIKPKYSFGIQEEAEDEGEDEGPGPSEWMETYQELLDAGWPWRVACYVAWASSPKIGRWPKTQFELATEVLGLTSDRQITTWRKRNSAIDEMIAVMQAAPLMAHRADVMRALALSASDPDHRSNPDRKLFLEMTGDWVPKSKIEVQRRDADDLSGMSDAELDEIARRGQKATTDFTDKENGG